MIDEKAEKFFRIVRDAHPDVPVIIVESPMYAYAMFDTKIHDIIVRKNEARERLYKKLKKAGEKKLWNDALCRAHLPYYEEGSEVRITVV